MAGPASTKKQVSLVSFFAPKTINGLRKPQTQPPKPESEAQAQPKKKTDAALASEPATRKRPLEPDAAAGNSRREPTRKRSRVVLDDSDFEDDAGDQDQDDGSSYSPPKPAPETIEEPPKQTSSNSASRTERYLYDGSRSREKAGADEDEDEDAATIRRKQELHRKFVKKLGHPDSMLRWRSAQVADTAGPDDEDGDGGVDEDEPPPPAKGKKKGAKTGKLTPMEVQFLDIKRKHMDTVLIVEVGYKFRFFGEDARIAAKELSIVCISGKFRYDEHPSEAHLDRFASASIPVHRLPVHAKRLVAAGHKVGVVRQIETAALKKAGDNRNAPFVRKLTNVYTKGTYIDDELGEPAPTAEGSGAPAGGYLLCITESAAKGAGTDEKVDVGLIAVQPATGDIIYDSFEDGFMRNELETRLLHISPCELLIVGDLSRATEKLVRHLSGSASNVFGDRTRVERVAKGKTMATEASSHVTQFYAGKLKDTSQDERAVELLHKVLGLPEPVTLCLSAMITHLTEFGLEHIFDLTKYFQSFSTRTHMLINGTTLESLEVYRNQTDHGEKGSLFWALDKTKTRFGQRMLRKWLGRPLLDKERLDDRVAAVEELFEKRATAHTDKLQRLVASIKTDLERSLIRIFYGRCTRPELLAVLQTLQRIAVEYARVKEPSETGFESRLTTDAICSLPAIRDTVVEYLNRINPEAARNNDKYDFFRDDTGEDGEDNDISNHKLSIASVEQDLDAHRADAAAKLGRKKAVDYVTVAGIEYLIEVPNTDLRRVPASWAKISGTKKLSRFHTPDVVRLIAERDQHKEALAAACDAAFKAMLASIADEYQPLRDAVASLATLDCLLCLAQVAALPGYSKPTILPSSHPPTISITEGRHPIAEHTLPGGYIPFTTTLAAPAPLAHLVTGPNMGGKSSFVRALALVVLLAQVGSYVPAAAARLTLSDAIYTRMGASDNLFAGESTFMVEVGETAAILRAATPRSLVLLDELGRGTSTHDGAAIAHAVLDHVVRETRCLTLFITHYQSLARVAEGLGHSLVRNVHMRFSSSKAEKAGDDAADAEDDVDEEITFLYEVTDGVAHRSYGLNVARLARIPRKILDVAARKSRHMEDEVKMRRLRGAAKLLDDVCHGRGGDDMDQLDHLVSSIEQL
ncbi:hypothetical protein RB595_007587 [Gaeumannomyces hyphopodioides]